MDQPRVRSRYHQDAIDEYGSFAGSVGEFMVCYWQTAFLLHHDHAVWAKR
jgi:hypothetical protein